MRIEHDAQAGVPTKVLLDACGHVQVFGGARVPPPQVAYERRAKHAEGTGDVVDEIELGQARFSGRYGDQVFQRLQARHQGSFGIAHAQIARDTDDSRVIEVARGVAHHVVVERGVSIQGHDDFAGGNG